MKNRVLVFLVQPKPVTPKSACEHSKQYLKMEQSNNICIRNSKSLRISEQFLLTPNPEAHPDLILSEKFGQGNSTKSVRIIHT